MKLKLHLPREMPLENFFLAIACFCVVTFAMLEHTSIPIPAFSYLKLPIMYVGGISLLLQCDKWLGRLLKRKYFWALCVLIVMCIFLMLSAFINRNPDIGTSPMRATIRLILFLLELFFLMVWVAESGKGHAFVTFVFYYALILTLITDFLMFSRLIVFKNGRFEEYLVGTKFSVCYLHINLLALWFWRNRERFVSDRKARRILWIGIPFITFVCIYVDCMTGVLGCIALLVLLLLLNTPLERRVIHLNSPLLLSACLGAGFAFPFAADAVVSIPWVEYLVQTLLNRDLTLTGRIDIFDTFLECLRGHWLGGYGYGNGNAVTSTLYGFANLQNALLQWILQAGIPVAVLLCVWMLVVFYYLSISPRQRQIMPLIALIYIYIFIGFAETSYDMNFIMWLGIIFMLITERKKEPTLS